MAYQTGTVSTLDALLTTLATFATTQGWTIVRNTAGLLFLSKGQCFCAMQRIAYNYNNFETGVSVSTPDERLDMALATSLTAGLTTFFGHPGSLSTTATDTDRVICNQLLGPFGEYHFFSGNTGAGDPDYIYVVLKIGADNWRHFGFGNVDKGVLTHSGAAFLGGQAGHFFRNQVGLTGLGQPYNDPQYAEVPYCRSASAATPFTNSSGNRNFYVPDALPNTADWPVHTTNPMNLIELRSKPSTLYPSTGGGPFARLCNPMMIAPVSQWGGNAVLFPLPIFIGSATALRSCYIGDFPNIRLVNMEGLLAGQEIVLAGDTWKVFSIGRQTPWGTQTENGFQYTTGQVALAYKKIP